MVVLLDINVEFLEYTYPIQVHMPQFLKRVLHLSMVNSNTQPVNPKHKPEEKNIPSCGLPAPHITCTCPNLSREGPDL